VGKRTAYDVKSKLKMSRHEKSNPIHESGITMPRSLFDRLNRILANAQLWSRGELMLLGITTIIDMCESPSKRYLPEFLLQYDKRRSSKAVKPPASDLPKAKKLGTHFNLATEERIKAVVKPIGWSRNQFINEATRIIVEWCEDPSTRVLPVVVVLYDAVRAYTSPSKLKRQT
jgi:hypothetical protein